MFQSFHLLPFLNARENIELPFLYLKTDGARDPSRVGELLNFVGLGDKDRRYPSELSAGEQQRVAIARALILGADLILADEPTGNLDPGTAQTVMDLFDRLIHQGKTLVLVTHDPSIAARGHRHLHLEAGCLQASGVASGGAQP